MTEKTQDISPGPEAPPRGSLPGSLDPRAVRDESGASWSEARRSLRPDYARVKRDMAICYLMLALGLAIAGLVSTLEWEWQLLVTFGLALHLGFWLHALGLFGHEGAHFNLAPDRTRSDCIANRFVFLFFGGTVAAYRQFHWQHHLHLGDRQDTEVSYWNCTSPWFLFKLFSGLYLVEALLRYGRGESLGQNGEARAEPAVSWRSAARSALVHGLVVLSPLPFGLWCVSGSWAAGVLLVYPACNSLRQLLEHRHLDAGCERDFSAEPHGANTHVFGEDLFSRFFGAAGFNRHLLHHWDPTVSYTNFPEMEDFMRRAGLGGVLANSRRSYWGAMVRALKAATRA